MTALFVVLIMVLVGALIGGVTNSLAIKMLFRPYQAMYIGTWRVPFTPGLIPKRRTELADQLGKLVVNHLLTADGLKKKLESTIFMTEITEWLNREVKDILRSDQHLGSVIEKWLGVTNGKKQIEQRLENWLARRSSELMDELRPLHIRDMISERLNKKLDEYIPEITAVFIEKAKDYFNSEEGIGRLSNMVDRFLAERGTLGNMVSMFLGNERLVDKIQPEIIKMLNDEGTHELLEVFIKKEWGKLKQLKVEEIEEHIDLTVIITFIEEKIRDNIPLDYLEKPLCEWAGAYESKMIVDIIPRFVQIIGQAISNELLNLLKKLEIEEIVKTQVEQFSVSRLEEIVLSISKRELKLITYLGALLGGLIGLFQGILINLIS
ncbi:DUF445 family protein [Bacillaceae bacterium IKA-2]|nr:DUF445 family protein [Bacillaceae bacterium IKA-2]